MRIDRTAAKETVERVIWSSGLPSLLRRRLRDSALVLAYHNVVPDDSTPIGDRSLHLPRAAFAAQLDTLMQTHDVVTLEEALGLTVARGTTRRRPFAAITFDDAYRGALTLGVAELRSRGLPAAVFVAPAFVGDGTFWWDAVRWPIGAPDGEAFRQIALEQHRGVDLAVREYAVSLGYEIQQLPDYARCVTEGELHAVARAGDVALGSHTWSHPNLAALRGETLRAELELPFAWLRERFARVLPVIAYPYGRWSPETTAAARAAGYAAGLRVDGGWLHTQRANRLAAPRVDVPSGLSRAGFALRASGLFCR
jgi:peptidoglycan/xylan/chitin deacetylase (PgdA/CDA1 family)